MRKVYWGLAWIPWILGWILAIPSYFLGEVAERLFDVFEWLDERARNG